MCHPSQIILYHLPYERTSKAVFVLVNNSEHIIIAMSHTQSNDATESHFLFSVLLPVKISVDCYTGENLLMLRLNYLK